jgi:hypothetical protein
MHHVVYQHPESGVTVELHWRLSPDFRDDGFETLLWTSLRDHTFFGVPTYILSERFLFQALCEHGAAHHWFRLKWLFDVAVLIDTGAISEDAPNGGRYLRNHVGAARVLCERLFQIGSPQATRGSPAQEWLAEQVLRQFKTFPITPTTGTRRYRYHLLLLNSKDPASVGKLFRYFFADHDQIRWHTRGWASYRASLFRLARRVLRGK